MFDFVCVGEAFLLTCARSVNCSQNELLRGTLWLFARCVELKPQMVPLFVRHAAAREPQRRSLLPLRQAG